MNPDISFLSSGLISTVEIDDDTESSLVGLNVKAIIQSLHTSNLG